MIKFIKTYESFNDYDDFENYKFYTWFGFDDPNRSLVLGQVYMVSNIKPISLTIYKNQSYDAGGKLIDGICRELTKKELQDYIYNDHTLVKIFINGKFENYRYSRIKLLFKSKEDTEKMRLKHMGIDPYGEEDWFDD